MTDETKDPDVPTLDEFSAALAKLPVSGETIVSTAIDIANQKRSERVMKAIVGFVDNVRELDEAIRIAQHMRAEYVKRLEAVKAGKFAIGLGDKITFDESALNAPVIDPRYEGARGRL